jgi:hypothetical protein
MSKLKWFAQTPAMATQTGPSPSREGGDPLPEQFSPPEVIHGSGGEADWALWDDCVAAWDQAAAAAAANTAPA